MFDKINYLFDLCGKLSVRGRAICVWFVRGVRFRRLGKNVRLTGLGYMVVGEKVSIGNFCWIEAVYEYAGKSYAPKLWIETGVAISDFTHISAVGSVHIGENCLLGSKIYIGDHNHGSIADYCVRPDSAPAKRELGDISPISIGRNTWICDGAVILAGSDIAPGSIIGANSVVRLKTSRAAIIAGAPAVVVRYLESLSDG